MPNTGFLKFPLPVRTSIWLIVALAINGLIAGISATGLMAVGEPPKEALKATSPGFGLVWWREHNVGADSWMPMLTAHQRHEEQPGKLYSVFFEDRIKFQYPPSSLLLLDAVPRELRDPARAGGAPTFKQITGRLSRFTGLLVVIVSIATLEVSLRRTQSNDGSDRSRNVALRLLLGLSLGFTFYPLIKAHSLGQVQIYLNLIIGLAILFYLSAHRGLSGICIGLCALVKPQYGLILLWGMLRRQWRFVALGLCTVAIGVGLAVLRFGWSSHTDYIDVLRLIGRHGEVYWPNQTVNGLFTRFLQPAEGPVWRANEYAPYHPVVYFATVSTSLALLVAAFRPTPSSREPSGDAHLADFLIAPLAVTIASPVAWEHHYGILLPIFAGALPVLMQKQPLGRWTAPVLALSFAASANVLLRPGLIFTNRWIGISGSHLFFGAIAMLVLLFAVRSQRVHPAA